jgi:hypothetical protein
MMTLTATEVLGAFQLGIISMGEAREKLGFAKLEGDDE